MTRERIQPYNWLRVRRMVDKLNAIREAYGALSDQPMDHSSRQYVEEQMIKFEAELDAEVARVTVARLQKELWNQRIHDIQGAA